MEECPTPLHVLHCSWMNELNHFVHGLLEVTTHGFGLHGSDFDIFSPLLLAEARLLF